MEIGMAARSSARPWPLPLRSPGRLPERATRRERSRRWASYEAIARYYLGRASTSGASG
jgi:hypothetical protein